MLTAVTFLFFLASASADWFGRPEKPAASWGQETLNLLKDSSEDVFKYATVLDRLVAGVIFFLLVYVSIRLLRFTGKSVKAVFWLLYRSLALVWTILCGVPRIIRFFSDAAFYMALFGLVVLLAAVLFVEFLADVLPRAIVEFHPSLQTIVSMRTNSYIYITVRAVLVSFARFLYTETLGRAFSS